MSIDTEQDSAAMKYIEEVFNTLYVTQEGLRSFNIDQQEKFKAQIMLFQVLIQLVFHRMLIYS